MAYTVQVAYMKVLEAADKMGSDYFPQPLVLSRFKTVTYDFLGQKAKEIEMNQEVTDDIKSLVVHAPIAPIPDPNEANCWLASQPLNYHTRLAVIVKYVDGTSSRMPTVERIGEHNSNLANPFKNPTKDYPLIQQMGDYFKIYPGNNNVSKFYLSYLRKPIFGINDNDMIVDLPVQVVEALINDVATSLIAKSGDPRTPVDIQVNESFRKPR